MIAGLSALAIAAALVLAMAPSPARAEWEALAGYEGDSNDSSYASAGVGYAYPLTEHVALAARVFGSYLRYRFRETSGETTVDSPGATVLGGVRLSGAGVSFTLMAGPEVRWDRRERTGRRDETEDKVGAEVNATLWASLSPRWDVLGIVNFDSVHTYTWGRATVKYLLTDPARPWRISVGPEGTLQGNSDIFSVQGGGVLEVGYSPSRLSLDVRAGYKHSTFDVGPDRDDAYWGVGLYMQF